SSCIYSNLVRSGSQQSLHIVYAGYPSADRERNRDFACRFLDYLHHSRSTFNGSRNVQEHELVRPFPIINGCKLNRIARITQIDEVDTLHDPAVLHIQAWNNSFG